MMNVLYLHYSFMLVYLVVEVFLGGFLMYVLFSMKHFYVAIPFMYCLEFNNIFSISLDWMSLIFSSVVIFIAMVMSMFSFYYFSSDNFKTFIFLSLKMLFVLSMLLVILFSDLFFIMLGWDGLGFVSFLLILYYQSSNSMYSAIFTILMNRIGDAMYLLSLGILVFFSSSIYSDNMSLLLLLLMLLTFMTKSALFPFSSWLPIAMAAPTPISALVHSSTLVTAGLYLMIRYSFLFYSSYSLMQFLLLVSLFTSFYAGCAVLVEVDLKKVIALSTLSHLGFIAMAFSLGLSQLAFFHLLSHALFKSLLFMSMGDMMVNLFHSQDSRFISNVFIFIPYSTNLMRLSLLNLLGLPNLSGFYSKDLILEFFMLSTNSFYIYLIMLINLMFTFYYTFVLLNMSYSSIKSSPFYLLFKPSSMYLFMAFCLALMSVMFGKLYLQYVIYLSVVSIISLMKFLPQFLLLVFILMSILYYQLNFISSKKLIVLFSSMLYLHLVIKVFLKKSFLLSLFYSMKSLEHGMFYSLANSSFSVLSSKLNVILLNVSGLNWYMLFYSWIFLLYYLF